MGKIVRVDDKPGSCEGCYSLGGVEYNNHFVYYCRKEHWDNVNTTTNEYDIHYGIISNPQQTPSWCKRFDK